MTDTSAIAQSIKLGEYPIFVFGEYADDNTYDEFITHTQYPRFLARLIPNEASVDIDSPVSQPISVTQQGDGDDTIITVSTIWDEEVISIEFKAIVNLDAGVSNWNDISDACLAAAGAWWGRTIQDNTGLDEDEDEDENDNA